jgi:GT2 family glycosyltransferase
MVTESLWVVIPTADRREYIPAIIKESNVPKEQIVIVHTKENNEPYPEVNNIYDTGEINIHRWWNRGIDYALARGARYVAVLNDDVELADDPLNKIVAVMKQNDHPLGCPYPFEGWVSGYCWILDLASDVRPDEKYRWWYGDRDLYLQAREVGTVCAVACKVRHIHGNELTRNNPKLMELTKIDEEYFFDKWKDVITRG